MVNPFSKLFSRTPASSIAKKAQRILDDALLEEATRTAEAKELLGIRETFIAAQETVGSPWAMFEVVGFEDDGRIKVEFNWNPSFITRLNEMGFTAETPEDTVQLFFYTAQMKPTSLDGGDSTVRSDDLPTLSQNANRIVK